MKKIRVTETFYSVQGEGRYTGAPSVFLRTYGCNFECRGFSMPAGQKTDEPERLLASIDLKSIKHISELPLSKTGCDSYVSWHKDVKHLQTDYQIDDLIDHLVSLTPQKSFKGIHLVITGGEPLLGWQRAYPDLLHKLYWEHRLESVTFETNGTQALTSDLMEFMRKSPLPIHFSVSTKLACSGHTWNETIKPGVISDYGRYGAVDLKFVVDPKDSNTIEEIKSVLQAYEGMYNKVFVMPEGGIGETYERNAPLVAQLALENGWNFSPRLQVPLFGNAWGT